MASSFHLLVAIPDKEPISYSLSDEAVTLGRSPVNDIQILVREVSTSHCEFKLTDEGYQITDVGSTNGTKVNDRTLKESVMLSSRDVILLGETIPAYFIVAAEGADIDMKSEIAEIEKSRSAPKKPTVKHLTAPGAVKKVGLPTKKPLASAPLAVATPAAASDVGSATVKLAQTPPRPTTKLGTPPVKKLAPPGAPAAKKLPALTKKAASLPTATPVAKESQAAPAVKLAAPGPPPATAAPAVKLAAPGPPPATGTPPVKLAAPGPPPAKKLSVPSKKLAPKLNLPPKKED